MANEVGTRNPVAWPEPVSSWKIFWAQPGQRREFITALICLIAVMLGMLRFLHYVEARPGVQLYDPILEMLPPVDLNKAIFFLLYSGLIVGIAWLVRRPEKLLLAMEVYAVYALFRILALWMVPLEPPAGIIPLVDPILSYASTGIQINKDLFFSGHTATFSIFYFMLPGGGYKTAFLAGLIAMALCLIFQRVHYTIDVVAAPLISYAALQIILRKGILKKL